MGSNGAYIVNRGDIVLTAGSDVRDDIIFPPGSGGGCVHSEPFSMMTVNLGPVAQAMTNGNGSEDGSPGYGPGLEPALLGARFQSGC